MLHLPPHVMLMKMIAAVVLGGAIGFERELRSKSAGFRTMILICLGATMYTMFSQVIGFHTSPDRIASNIVVGIGFLGAGVIFRGDSKVTGITTAATIWLTASLGIGLGMGWYAVAITGCALVLIVLFILSFLDRVIDKVNQVRDYKIVFPYEEFGQHKYEALIAQYGLTIKTRAQKKSGNIITGEWTVKGTEKNHHAFIENILKDAQVTEFDF